MARHAMDHRHHRPLLAHFGLNAVHFLLLTYPRLRSEARAEVGSEGKRNYSWSVEDDDLEPEHDLRTLLKGSVRGKYAERFQQGSNLVLLDPEVAKAFPNHQAVNDALRLVIQLSQLTGANKKATT